MITLLLNKNLFLQYLKNRLFGFSMKYGLLRTNHKRTICLFSYFLIHVFFENIFSFSFSYIM